MTKRGKIPISNQVEEALKGLLHGQRLYSVTPDREREFRRHGNVTAALGVEFYFPKGYDFNKLSDYDLQKVVEQLNRRPRKCLGYKTPWEVYFSTMLHLA